MKRYQALAYYCFVAIEDPHLEVCKHKYFFRERAAAGRIYISEEGINGQISGTEEDMDAYRNWLCQDLRFAPIEFKVHSISELIFPRFTIKYRKQLVAIDQKIDLSERGEKVSSERWKEMLESGKYLLLDVRNQYEWEIGHFEGATLPPLKYFREFPSYVEQLSKKVSADKTPVMMYCTGGIRCELYSALLKKVGFSNVYQLDGGVIKYGLEVGSAHWKGKLFVFDDRMAISIDGKQSPPLSKCIYCNAPSDTYYNCANMDCNTLFICCSSCIEKYLGCCQITCQSAPRIRCFNKERGNKPFRRKGEL